LTVGAISARTAGRLRQLIGTQLAGPVLALLLVQHRTARGRHAPK
jgi:hypothetical protein